MGEVYLANDSRLDRLVAIKALPDHLATDPDRLSRFEREARTLASLNHPNVAGIYGVEEQGGRKYLILEYVEGQTLAERIDRGALPFDEAMEVCLQIAAGVEAAHEAAIIHRDLKPANIKITPDGKVRVLDFGLAKIPEESSSGSNEAETITSPAHQRHSPTMPGVILGTAAYMSPEQARGRLVDRRTDIWSFGLVLFECLTGANPFVGETVTDSIGAILHKDVDLTLLPKSVTPGVRQLLRRCFERDKTRRLQAIGDARIEMEEALQRSEHGACDESGAGTTRSFPWVWASLSVLLAIALGASQLRTPAPEQVTPDLRTADFRQVTDLPGQERGPSISPDGKNIVFAHQTKGNSDIYVQRVGGRTPINLTADSPEDDWSPAFSPDGESIAFRSDRGDGGIFVMGATGESVRRVVDFGYDPAWSPDGTQLVLSTEGVDDPVSRSGVSSLWIVNLDGGGKRKLTQKNDAIDASWSPDGKRIAYWGWREPDWQRDIFTIATDGSEPEGISVTDDAPVDWTPVWMPDGRGLYFGSNRGGTMNLWRIDVDPQSGLPEGQPVQVTTPSLWSGSFSTSRNGERLVYETRDEQASLMTVDFDPQAGALVGKPRQIFGGRALVELDWSPAGQRLVVTQRGDPWESMAIIQADGTGYSRITDASIQHRRPMWRPIEGSERIMVASNANLVTLRSDGSDLRQVGLGEHCADGAWSADGRSLITLLQNERWEASELLRYDFGPDDTTSRAVWSAPPIKSAPQWICDWSPDGARVLIAEASEKSWLHMIDLGTGKSKRFGPFSNDPGARWLPDGRRAIVNAGSGLILIDVEMMEQRQLVDFGDYASGGWIGAHALTRDGCKLAYIVPHGEGNIWLMDLTGARD